jgi:hypothetical protein
MISLARSKAAFTLLAVLAAIASVPPASAEVTRVEVTSRTDIAFPGYEKIVGRVFFAVDPANPRNAVVVDLDKATRDGAGRVEFSADFYIVRPKTGGNGAAILDIVNRGGKSVIRNFNRVGSRDPDVGDAFLMKRGFTVVAVGWEFDLPGSGQPQRSPGVAATPRTDDLIRISVPAATDPSGPITGIVRGSFTPSSPNTVYTVGDLVGYAPVDATAADSMLTVRDSLSGPSETIPRDRWQLAGTTVTLSGGFTPGRIYELSFRAEHPPIGGLGFVAVRDFATWIKHDASALTNAKYVYSFGNSQSGRFLRTFVYQGFNSDEEGRQVLDAVLANIAGSARLDLNRRWATPMTATALATAFPFAAQALKDPVSGVSDGLLENPRAAQNQPKIFFANTGVEYWSSAGRVAALTHASPDGSMDLSLPDNVRSYFFAGTQHSPAGFPPDIALGQQRGNPTDYWWTWRALLVAMDDWVRTGTAPPASQVPALSDQTLVDVKNVAFPAIPAVQSPKTLAAGVRVPNLFVDAGAGGGTPLPLLVPQVDADGNERAGIRLPDVAVPLATLTGWNFRNHAIGGTHQIVSLLGSYVPFARTRAEREQNGDPRLSIEERYASREKYLSLIKDAANGLVRDRVLLAEDVEPIMQRAAAQWDYLVKPAATASSRNAAEGVPADSRR